MGASRHCRAVGGHEAGEGDLSLRWWLTAHRQEFAEQAEREGFEVDERIELVLEHFEVVWPVAR